MGISICVASGKGGAGKSTVCANLGLAVSQLGLKSVIVDADLEGSSIPLIFGTNFESPTVHNFLSGTVSAKDIVIKSQSGLELAVGSVKVEDLPGVDIKLLKTFIKSLTEEYDIVLVDAPSGLGLDTITALSACNTILLVVTPDILSISNALKTKVIAERMGFDILGMLINRAGGAYDIPDKQIEDLMGIKVLAKIEEDDEIKRSLLEGSPLLLYNPASKTSKSIVRLAEEMVGKQHGAGKKA